MKKHEHTHTHTPTVRVNYKSPEDPEPGLPIPPMQQVKNLKCDPERPQQSLTEPNRVMIQTHPNYGRTPPHDQHEGRGQSLLCQCNRQNRLSGFQCEKKKYEQSKLGEGIGAPAATAAQHEIPTGWLIFFLLRSWGDVPKRPDDLKRKLQRSASSGGPGVRCSAISECAELCAACIIGWIIHFVGWHYLTSIPLSGSRAGSTVMRGSIIGIRAVGTSVGAPGGPLAVHCLGLCGLPWPWCIVLIWFYFYSFFRVCYMVKRIHLQQPFFPLWRIIIQALLFRH